MLVSILVSALVSALASALVSALVSAPVLALVSALVSARKTEVVMFLKCNVQECHPMLLAVPTNIFPLREGGS